jgi:hypothetical protein
MTREEAERAFLDRIVGKLIGVHRGKDGPFEIREATDDEGDDGRVVGSVDGRDATAPWPPNGHPG